MELTANHDRSATCSSEIPGSRSLWLQVCLQYHTLLQQEHGMTCPTAYSECRVYVVILPMTLILSLTRIPHLYWSDSTVHCYNV